MIERSWRRCAEHGLAESDPALQDPLGPSELSQRQEENELLLHLASRELELLRESLSAEGIVALASPDGVILDARGDHDFMGRVSSVSLLPGAVWSEAREGTNGIGTAAVEQTLVQVRGDEHFLEENRFLICTAMPVMSPTGKLAGIVDLTGDARRPPSHCGLLVRLAVANIEHSWTRQVEGRDLLVAFHPHPASLGTPYEGLLAFRDGVLIGAGQLSLHLLGLGADVIGHARWDDIFNAPPTSSELRLQTDGVRFYARVERPAVEHARKTRSHRRNNVTVIEDALWDAETLELLARAERAMRTNIPILLHGETGTGKEVLVRALQSRAMPPGAPLVTVNCAAIPENLLEAELFGYQEGAFTGARRGGSPGYIRQADGGTLFLDEIGDMPTPPQSRLLRVLQDGEVTPLGGGKSVKVDFRLVAATHCDLRALVAEGKFRADLYYRLRHMVLTLAPLRERSNLPDILDALLRKWGALERGISLSPEARLALLRHTWPGNLRELSNLLRTLISLAEDNTVFTLDVLPPEIAQKALPEEQPSLAALTDAVIARVIKQNGGNMSAAARQLGIHRSTLYRRMGADA